MVQISKIGVFTSGGDSPGMNACIRAVVRTALKSGMSAVGIRKGFEGMIEGDFINLDRYSVSSIMQTGGTILKCARSARFRTTEGRIVAAERLKAAGIDGLVAIGGDGTLAGASVFFDEHSIPCVACPGTIDNDLFGTDETIGFDTAINTALVNLDRIRDTADAHNRLFLVEVMGRDSGFIAAHCGLAGGAEMVLIPETTTDIEEVKSRIHALMAGNMRSSIVVVAEGDELGGAREIADALSADAMFKEIELRVCVFGHVQRGGSPTARDRVLASRLGRAAVDALVQGKSSVMAGVVNNNVTLTPFHDILTHKKDVNREIILLNDIIN